MAGRFLLVLTSDLVGETGMEGGYGCVSGGYVSWSLSVYGYVSGYQNPSASIQLFIRSLIISCGSDSLQSSLTYHHLVSISPSVAVGSVIRLRKLFSANVNLARAQATSV